MTGLWSRALESALKSAHGVQRAELAQVESERARLGRDLEAELAALSCHGRCRAGTAEGPSEKQLHEGFRTLSSSWWVGGCTVDPRTFRLVRDVVSERFVVLEA